MAATVAGILLTGIHASRPSSGVSAGTLYSCTTHNLVYQTSDTGSTWGTWATLGTSGAYVSGGTDVAVADGGTGASTAAAARTNLGIAIELIADSLLGSDTATFDFTSISGSYKHLRLIVVGRTTQSASETWIKMTFNNDGSTSYDCFQAQAFLGGTNSAWNEDVAAASMAHAMLMAGDSATGGRVGMATVEIPNYASTTYDKIMTSTGSVAEGTSSTNFRVVPTMGFWRNTAAITRITLTPTSGNWKTGSRATLYGLL